MEWIRDTDFALIWREFADNIQTVLLELLLRFEVCFPVPEDFADRPKVDSHMIPALLPEEQPALAPHWMPTVSKEKVEFGRVYYFEFMPLAFFSRLIARCRHFPGLKLLKCWR